MSYPGPFTSGKGPWFALNMQLGRPQNQSGCFGEEENLLTYWHLIPRPCSLYSSLYTSYTVPALVLSYVMLRLLDIAVVAGSDHKYYAAGCLSTVC
jgi:hypothetical protein